MKGEKQSSPQLDPLSVALGLRVARLREGRDFTATDLAKLAEMDVNYLWRIEAGRQNLSLRNVARLAKALGVTLSDLFEGIDVSKADLRPRPYVSRADATVSKSKLGKNVSSIK